MTGQGKALRVRDCGWSANERRKLKHDGTVQVWADVTSNMDETYYVRSFSGVINSCSIQKRKNKVIVGSRSQETSNHGIDIQRLGWSNNVDAVRRNSLCRCWLQWLQLVRPSSTIIKLAVIVIGVARIFVVGVHLLSLWRSPFIN